MRFLYAFSAFITMQVLACPTLEGTYKNCQSSKSEIKIEQKVVNKYLQYTFTTNDSEEVKVEKFIADGKTRLTTETDSDTGIAMKTWTTAYCSGETLIVKMEAWIDNEELAKMTFQTTKIGTKLSHSTSGMSMGSEVNETIICE